MSFGLEITGVDSGGEFLVTSTDLNLSHYIVTSAGYGTSATSLSTAGTNVFINAKHLPGREIVALRTATGYNFRQVTVNFVADFSTFTAVSITTAPVSVYYFVAEQPKGIPTPTGSAGDFGLQIFQSDGTAAFDSRKVQTNNSFFVTEFYDGRGSTNSYISTNTNAYAEASTTSVGSDFRTALYWDSGGIRYRSNIWFLVVNEFSGGSTAGTSGRIPPLLLTSLR